MLKVRRQGGNDTKQKVHSWQAKEWSIAKFGLGPTKQELKHKAISKLPHATEWSIASLEAT